MTEGGQRPFTRTVQVVFRERVRERRTELDRAGAVGAVLAVVGVFAWSFVGAVAASILVGLGLIFMRVGFGARPGLARETVTRPARVRITSEGVDIEDEPFVRREDIAQAYHQPRRVGLGTVRALDAAGDVLFELEAKNENERSEILRALGRDVAHGRASFRSASPLFTTTPRRAASVLALVALVALAVWGRPVPYLLHAVGAAFVILAGLLSRPQHVEVGVDGLLVRWIGRSRFVSYERVRAVDRLGGDLAIALIDGPPLRLSATKRGGRIGDDDLERDALVARIEEARRAFASRALAGELAARLARQRRAVAEWRAELARLHEGDRGYRDAVARGDDLWRVVEDAGAPEDARAGAAMVLRGEEGAPARLRVAADTVASPKLRVALERAADPDTEEAALDEALDAMAREA